MCVVLANSTGVVQHLTPTMRQLRVPAFLLPDEALAPAASSDGTEHGAPRAMSLVDELAAELEASYLHGQGGVDEGVFWGAATGDGEPDAGKTMAARRDHDGEGGGGGGGGRRRRGTGGSGVGGAASGAGGGGAEVSAAHGIVRAHVRAVVASHHGDMIMAIPDSVRGVAPPLRVACASAPGLGSPQHCRACLPHSRLPLQSCTTGRLLRLRSGYQW